MSQVRIAVAGAGMIGRKHISVLRSGHPDYTLAAVVDPAPAAAEEAKKLGYPIYATLEEMIEATKPDGVVAAVPNQAHVSVGLACIARGIPVLVEKPIADSVAAGRELVATAEKAGVPVLVGHHRRHNPIMRKAAEIVAGGGVGRIVAATAAYLGHKPKGYHDQAWRREPGGGPVLLNSIHDIDCLRMLCGDIDTVQATASNGVRGFAVEDTAGAVLRFKNGAIGTLIVSDTASTPWSWEWGSRENPAFPFDSEYCFTISGTQGCLAVPTLVHRWHEKGQESWENPLTSKRHYVPLADAYVEQLRNFAAVIRGREKPVLDGRGGLLTLATTLAITQSATTGQLVRVDDMIATAA